MASLAANARVSLTSSKLPKLGVVAALELTAKPPLERGFWLDGEVQALADVNSVPSLRALQQSTRMELPSIAIEGGGRQRAWTATHLFRVLMAMVLVRGARLSLRSGAILSAEMCRDVEEVIGLPQLLAELDQLAEEEIADPGSKACATRRHKIRQRSWPLIIIEDWKTALIDDRSGRRNSLAPSVHWESIEDMASDLSPYLAGKHVSNPDAPNLIVPTAKCARLFVDACTVHSTVLKVARDR